MLQIAVVEDDVAASDTIRTYLNTILAEKQMSANIHVYDTAEQLIACRDMRQYHMALFDIELPVSMVWRRQNVSERPMRTQSSFL